MKPGRSFWSSLLVCCLLSVPAQAAQINVRTLSQEGFAAKYDPNNSARPGVCIEIMRALEALDPELKFVGAEILASTARIETALTYGDIDVFFGHIKTTARQARFVYAGPPLYRVSQALAVRRDDPVQVQDWNDVRKLGQAGVILVVKGTGQVEYLRAVGGLQIDDQAPLISSNLKKLIDGRGRFYYGSENTLVQAIKAQRLEAQVKVLPVRFQRVGLYASFSPKASPELVKRIARGLEKLNRNGELARIRARYYLD